MWGMSHTTNRGPATSARVRETPFKAIDPFSTRYLADSSGISTSRRPSPPTIAKDTTVPTVVNMAAHIVAAHLASSRTLRSRFTRSPVLQAAEARATDSLFQEVEVNLLLVEISPPSGSNRPPRCCRLAPKLPCDHISHR